MNFHQMNLFDYLQDKTYELNRLETEQELLPQNHEPEIQHSQETYFESF